MALCLSGIVDEGWIFKSSNIRVLTLTLEHYKMRMPDYNRFGLKKSTRHGLNIRIF